MQSSTQPIQAGQVPLDAVNILELGVELCLAKEVRQFLDAIPEPPSVTEARFQVISAYESGAIGAVEAFHALDAHGCLNDADEVMRYFVRGYYASLGIPPTNYPDDPDPEPPATDPAAPKTVRVTSHAQGMLEALADVRKAREVAA
jgi:hypothetical protein